MIIVKFQANDFCQNALTMIMPNTKMFVLHSDDNAKKNCLWHIKNANKYYYCQVFYFLVHSACLSLSDELVKVESGTAGNCISN